MLLNKSRQTLNIYALAIYALNQSKIEIMFIIFNAVLILFFYY